jgi:hypothetical protein
LWSVFGDDLRIFRSSDDGSISTGVDQYPSILQSLAQAKVFIILVSKYSASRPWVNFEAGFAKGRGIDPFAVLIRNTSNYEVPTPLSQLELRPLGTESVIDEIVTATASATGREAKGHNANLFISQLRKKEGGMPDRQLSLRPFRFNIGANTPVLGFEILYKGPRPLQLIKVSAGVPWDLVCKNWPCSGVTGHLTSERVTAKDQTFLQREYIANTTTPNLHESGIGWRPLHPHLEPSDQPRFLRELRFALTTDLPGDAADALIRCQIIAADGSSPVLAFRFGDIEIRSDIVMPG